MTKRYTYGTQNAAGASSCGFDSHLRHSYDKSDVVQGWTKPINGTITGILSRITMQKSTEIFIHSLPLALGILLSYLFWRSNILLLVIYLSLVLLVILAGKDRKTELWIFAYGLVAGFIVETIGTQISGYQIFTKPDVWGIPYWLIVSWGFGFILMKRISLIIATGSPWAKTLG